MKMKSVILMITATAIILMMTSCVSESNRSKPVVGKGSSLSYELKQMVNDIQQSHDLKGQSIQISPNSFWQRDTQINLPFSSVLSDLLTAELSKVGAITSTQEIGGTPLKIVGSYTKAGADILIIAKLRRMGETASQDLATAQGVVGYGQLSQAWFEPKFDRIARSLVRKLENDYSGMTTLNIVTQPFSPGNASQSAVTLGKEVAKYMNGAFVSSFEFQTAGNLGNADSVLVGEYSKMGPNMIFHTIIKDKKTGKNLASASFETPMANIPKELLMSNIQSLNGLSDVVAKNILSQYKNSSAYSKEPGKIFIGTKSFHDATSHAIVPLSLSLAERFKETFSQSRLFIVTDNPSTSTNFILSGKIIQNEGGIVLSAGLDMIVTHNKKLAFQNIATDQERLDRQFCQKHWFKVDLKGKTDFLIKSLEKESLSSIPEDKRFEISITKFKFTNTKSFSQFSDVLNEHVMDYFSESRFYMPIRNPEIRMNRFKMKGVRGIMPTKKSEATQAVLLNANYYIEGSFWPNHNGGLDINATLASVDGRVLATSTVNVPDNLIDKTLVKPIENFQSQSNMQALSAPTNNRLAVELMTQRGRNNVSFQSGEEITFYLKANRDVYVNIFAVDVDNQIFRIYPNDFSTVNPIIKTGEVTAVPNQNYANDFAFNVEGKTGNEMVFAFASNRPLPEVPGSTETEFYGVTKMSHDIQGIKQWFSDYASQRGLYLSWDSIPILTRP